MQRAVFPGCCFPESHSVEGGKVIKSFGLEKPFYFRSHWAGVNKDGIRVNSDLINPKEVTKSGRLESQSGLLPRVIELDCP